MGNWIADIQKLNKRIDWLYEKVKCLLQGSQCSDNPILQVDQNNKVEILTIPEDSLSGEGTLEEQIAEWFNINGPIPVNDKTNLVIEIDYPDTPVVEGKPFGVDTTIINYCLEDVTTNFSLTLYHKGEFDWPTFGDRIYEDQACTTSLILQLSEETSWSCQGHNGTQYKVLPFMVDNESKFLELTCK